jgi:prophage regulatory protein
MKSAQAISILSPKQLTEQIGLSPATLWRMRQRGELPEPIRLSPGRVGWRTSDIEAWLASRAGAAGR